MPRRFPFALSLLLIASSTTLGAENEQRISKDSARGIAFFETRIRPVLVTHCYKCHSQDAGKDKGGLQLDSRAAMHKGGDSGPAVVPGDPGASILLEALAYETLRMPPSKKLPDEVIADFRKWIEMGAPDPRDGTTTVKKPAYAPSADLWCLKPGKQPEIPAVKDAAWPRGDIDRFILAALEDKGLRPVADAEPAALLRRVFFDLTGLPPSPQQVEAFLRDPSPVALAQVVDQLLDSPQFGERWGRHWLDVARYAESNGKDRDALYPHAWRYRNYVIDAFNKDKPYNQFIQEQVAGDLLPASKDEKEEHLIATGFLALGPKSLTQRGEKFTMDLVDDQIDTTARAVLALTVGCARCHDHKFDPIPTKDYYSLASIFRSTTTYYGSRNKNNSNLLALGMKGSKGARPVPAGVNVKQLQRQARQARQELKRVQQGKASNKQKQIAALKRKIRDFQQQIKNANQGTPTSGRFAMGVGEGKPVDGTVLLRGEIGKNGEPAPRGFLSAVTLDRSFAIPADQSGRFQLGQWLTDPSNPLTARVAVNRLWHHLLGRGLVRTVDNFGHNGEKPSHPELLDYLAEEFIRQGWSMKKMIRTIVLTHTYQLGSYHDDKNYAVDPDNTLLWRHPLRRLDAESIRDATLAVSGKLDLNRPEKSVVAQIGYGEVGRGINTKPLEAEFNHRSVYLPILRTLVPEILRTFDFPEPSLVVGERSVTTVPTQALYLMNSPFIIANAKSLAERLQKESGEDLRRIDLAYLRCFARPATEREQQLAQEFLSRCQERLQATKGNPQETRQLAWTSYCQALLASAEFRYVR
jgi:cytochrome c553